jgi:hypothetical protein
MRSPDGPAYGGIHRPFYGVVAFVIAAGFGYLAVYATGEDGYFTSGDVSRWDWAVRNGHTSVVVTSFVIALAAVIALVLAARSRASTGLRRVAALLAWLPLPRGSLPT